MKKGLVKIWRLSFFSNFMFTLLIFYPVFKLLFSTPKFYGSALWLQRRWAAWLMFWAGVRTRPQYEIHTEGTGPYIWCPNHTSALDILAMYATVPNEFHFVAKKEHAKAPLFGVMFTKTHIPIQRDSMTDSYKAMQRALVDLKRGIDIVLFPEGTMNFEKGKLLKFKSGAFKLACDADLPVLPVFMPDNLDRLPFTYKLFYPEGGPGKARIIVGKPIHPKDYNYDANAISEAVKDFMENERRKAALSV
jgi:1-acyl-sn-glycerol-3-phosphate acyltransferase